jgi:hypothetical protein
MTSIVADIAPGKLARLAGILYLLVSVAAGFAQSFRTSIIVPGDAAATVHNILASQSLFRLSFVSDLFAQVCQILLILALYALLKPVSKNYALLTLLFVVAYVPMVCINMLNQFAALMVLSGADYLKVFSADQVNALVMLFLDLHKYGYSIVGMFFGLWLLPLGYLVFKSGYFPKILGVLLMIGCFGYLIQFVEVFLFPGHDVITYPGLAIATVAELAFAFWLLIKGAKIPEMKD